MRNGKAAALAERLVCEIHTALWATLLAFALYFLAFILPQLPEARTRAERLRLHDIAAEDELSCGRLHMGPDAPLHDQCLIELQAYRSSVEKRLADSASP